MIDLFVLMLDVLYIAIALLQYFVAPRVGPNPYFGFRIGHTFANEEVWRKANRYMGKLMLVHALILLPTCLIPNFLGYFLLLWIVPMLLMIPVGIKYASSQLEKEGSVAENASEERIKPIDAGPLWNASPMIIYAALIAYMVITYPSMPAVIATHFDASGNPDGWMKKEDFFLFYSLLSLMFPAIAYIFVYLGRKYPIYVHPGKMRFPKDTYIKLTILAMDCAEMLMIFAYYTIHIYALSKISLPLWELLVPTLLVVIVPLAYLTAKWRR